jgi:acyl-CoA thioester hydrolase
VRPAHATTVELTVPFHDCDPLFVVWHGRYFQYLEKARTALLKGYDLDIPDIRQMGYRMFVTDVRCRYTFPLSYGEVVEVTAWFSQTTPLIRVAYDVYNVTKQRRAARAYTVLATTDANGKLLERTPDDVIARLPED